jgi:AcrR family transcriptional regulator
MTDVRAARSLTVKGAATRERILAAAVELMAVRGVAGTSTDDVRHAAGVSGSQLYHYFDDRQALIRAVITRQADAAASAGVGLELGALDSMEALRAWADAAIERQQQTLGDPDCDLSTLAGELHAADEGSRQEIATGFLRWKTTLVAGLTVMRDRGDLRQDADLNELASALLGALQGGQLLARTLGDTSGLSAPLNAALTYVASFAPCP